MTDVVALLAFLRVRLDEEAALARRLADRYRIRNPDRADNGQPYWPLRHVTWYFGTMSDPDIAAGLDLIRAYSPARVLAEVDAKRRILDEIIPLIDQMDSQIESEWGSGMGPTGESGKLLRLLALPYADDPGYRPEWRP